MQVITEGSATYMQLALSPRGFAARAGYPSIMRVRMDDYSTEVLEREMLRCAEDQEGGTSGADRMGSADLDRELFPITYFAGDPSALRSLRSTWDGHLAPRISLRSTGLVFVANFLNDASGCFESETLGYEPLVRVIRSWRSEQAGQLLHAAMSGGAAPAQCKSTGLSPL